MNKKQCLSILLVSILIASNAYGFFNTIVNNFCRHKTEEQVLQSSVCPGHLIPYNKTRNFRNEELRCKNGNHIHTRLPFRFDEEAWLDLKKFSRSEAAYLLRKQPSPQWSGQIHYETYVHWTWEECQLITDSIICGDYVFCDPETNNCENRAKSCYVDVPVYESEYCQGGDGQLDFDLAYSKKDASQWNPKEKSFIDRLANGYDLLPGEEEIVTVNTLKNSWWKSHSTMLTPTLIIEDPKNEYHFNQYVHDPQFDSLICRFHGYDKVSFTVDTLKRTVSASPNGFMLPKSFDNEPMDPIVWQSEIGRDGKRKKKWLPHYIQGSRFFGSRFG